MQIMLPLVTNNWWQQFAAYSVLSFVTDPKLNLYWFHILVVTAPTHLYASYHCDISTYSETATAYEYTLFIYVRFPMVIPDIGWKKPE